MYVYKHTHTYTGCMTVIFTVLLVNKNWFMVLSVFSTGLHPYLCRCDPSVHLPWTRRRRHSLWSRLLKQNWKHRSMSLLKTSFIYHYIGDYSKYL